METIKCITERRSIRKFRGEKVGRDVIKTIVSAAAFAPSWKNTQITRYIVVENENVKRRLQRNVFWDLLLTLKPLPVLHSW